MCLVLLKSLIVNLSDVLFDFNQASLKPGAREKLSKLAGILLAYPGTYHMEIEGHTDGTGFPRSSQRIHAHHRTGFAQSVAFQKGNRRNFFGELAQNLGR